MMRKSRSIKGANRRLRRMAKAIAERDALIRQWHTERLLLAKLAATGPAFFNPLEAFAAEAVRDRLLAQDGLNPDGTFKRSTQATLVPAKG